MRERTILMGGFSKAYAMTGWRVGYVAAPAAILEGMLKVHQYGIMSAPTTAQDAALAAIVEGEPDVERMLAEYDRRRRLIVDGLNALGLETFEPRGAFYAFPRIGSTGLTDDDVHRAAADRGARGGRPGECLRAVGRRPRPDVLRDLVRAARGGAARGSAGSSSGPVPEARPQAAPPRRALERYEAVIGIEVHCQLRTASKMFCGCSTAYDGAPPNTHVCPVCLGLPGALPTINRRAVEHVLTTGAAIEATAPAGDPLGSQELLLPGPAQGLPDQPVRPAARVAWAG